MKIVRAVVDLDPADRIVYIDRECADDPLLRQAVEALLLHQGDTTDLSVDLPVESQGGPSARGSSTSSSRPGSKVHQDRFQAGDVFADRYRIVSLLGRGGMGEVYRAHDTMLDVEIAIKFVRGTSAQYRERLIHEVRLAREVTHPAVCRVYDVGEEGEQLYLTMEYVDGEDMASLLSRIGRLPSDKVIDIAHQLCSGLAAAHSRGVIHRDLKPANVMIDGHGRVRITDFGIAVLESDVIEGSIAGTPAYMAPEQLTGGEVGPATDIYAVGLILYELVTGRSVFGGRSFSEIFTQKLARDPEPPSALTTGVEPRLEGVIEQAVRRNPSERPKSALAMSAALPGGDPLAMAVEAEITLDPHLVAAATDRRRLRWPALWGMLGLLVALLAAVLLLADPSSSYDDLADLKAPAVLADRAEQLVRTLGYEKRTGDVGFGFLNNSAAADPLDSVRFWYREHSDRALPSFVAQLLDEMSLLDDVEIPDAVVKEGIVVMLDHAGRLRYLHVGPMFGSRFAEVAAADDSYDWTAVLSRVEIDGLERARDEEVRLPVFSDDQARWTATGGSGRVLRVEAAAEDDRPVYLAVESDDPGSTARREQIRRRAGLRQAIYWPIYLVVALTALTLGVFNIVRERSDLRGAAVLVGLVLVVELLASVFAVSHSRHAFSSGRLILVHEVFNVVTSSLAVGLCYLGLEPFVRRRRPQTLVAWSRLLSGRVLDRSVGGSLLMGAVAGSAVAMLTEVDRWLLPRLGFDVAVGSFGAERLNAVLGPSFLLGTALTLLNTAVIGGILLLFIAAFLHHVIASRWLAVASFVVLVASVYTISSGAHLPMSALTFGVPTAAIALLVMHRFGLLALVVCEACGLLLTAYPMTTETRAWFAHGGFFAVGVVLVVGIIGFMLFRFDLPPATSESAVFRKRTGSAIS